MSIEKRIIEPDGWLPARGYSEGILSSSGNVLFIAGQVGWDEKHLFHSEDLVPQFDQALKNTLTILKEAGGGPEHICRMTCFCTDKKQYIESRKELGSVWKLLMGENFPAMSMIFVSDLLASKSVIEIETTAVLAES